MDKQTSREQFEEWADSKGFCLDFKFFEKGNNFECADTRMALEIWNASREALVVIAPEQCEYADAESDYAKGNRQGKRDYRDAIEAAGIRVEVQS